jgi:hypothetical protein
MTTFEICPKREHLYFIAHLVSNAVLNILYVRLVSLDAFIGSYGKSPFDFQHYDFNFAAFYVDGISVSFKPFQSYCREGIYLEVYSAFIEEGHT